MTTIVTNAANWSGKDITIKLITEDLEADRIDFELYGMSFWLERRPSIPVFEIPQSPWWIDRWTIRGADWRPDDSLGEVTRDERHGKQREAEAVDDPSYPSYTREHTSIVVAAARIIAMTV